MREIRVLPRIVRISSCLVAVPYWQLKLGGLSEL